MRRKCFGVRGVSIWVVVRELEISVGLTGTSKSLPRAQGSILARVKLGFVDEGIDDEMGSIDGLVVKIFIDSLFNIEVSIESLNM